MTKKKYILKPGKHQFVPRSSATHHNDNLSDSEAEWYLEKYPHIETLFIPQSEEQEFIKQEKSIAENISPLGDWEADQ